MRTGEVMMFLQTQGLFISPFIYEQLYVGALELASNHERRATFPLSADEAVFGEVCLETCFANAALGTLGGVEFNATVAIGARQFKVKFVVDERCLKEFVPGIWEFFFYRDGSSNQDPPNKYLN